MISPNEYGWNIPAKRQADREEISKVGRVAIFRMEPIKTMIVGTNRKILKLNIAAIASKVGAI